MDLDFRVPLIRERLESFRLVVPVASPKGGVGKTTVASALSLLLAREGIPTGLLDADFTNPTTHVMLGLDAESITPEEEKGVLPVRVEDKLEFMSPAFYSKDKPLPLRGHETVDALRELLAVTRWSSRILIVDSPPGLSDTLLELLRLHRDSRVLIISTCDEMSLLSTKRMIDFLAQEGLRSIGIVANMCNECSKIQGRLNTSALACLPLIEGFQRLEGNRDKVLEALGTGLEAVKYRIISLL
ncbi:P-loop NTPase [Infirmifilum uzonense]|uniref:P-loop NTPase n=1 Tax=Infirmifilum uzonense TaxID=1550241 RepID=UPI00069BDC49|nr:P-loop NTPase [Infirmifilum uzonense]